MRLIIVGGGISGLTAAYLARAAGHDVVCVDLAPRAGGLIRSERHEGYLCELGPQAVLDGAPDTRALIAALGLRSRALPASPAARRRFIYAGGRLHPLPLSPPALLRSSLLTPLGKLRLMAEPFVRARRVPPEDDAETVAAFGARRLGSEAARKLLATAVIGVYAADAAQLSMNSAFPRLAALERDHGSLFRGMIATRKTAMKDLDGATPARGPGRALSFPDGLGELTAALEAALAPAGRWRARVTRIERGNGPAGPQWRVNLEPSLAASSDGDVAVHPAAAADAVKVVSAVTTLDADAVVLAVGADEATHLLGPLVPRLRQTFVNMPAAPIAVCCLGFRDASPENMGMDLGAYGFLVARGQGPRLLGCQYESTTFPDRAPPNAILLRALLGGVGAGVSSPHFEPDIVEKSDDQIAARALADLATVAGLKRKPDFVRVWKYRRGIPLYLPGHAARLAALDTDLRTDALRGLFVIGHAFRGAGVNESIRAATALVRSLWAPHER